MANEEKIEEKPIVDLIKSARYRKTNQLAKQLAEDITSSLSGYKEGEELTPDQIRELVGNIADINKILKDEKFKLHSTRVQQLTDIKDSVISILEKEKINILTGDINENITRSLSEYNEVNELTPDQINKLGNNINQIDFILDDERLSPTRKEQLTNSKELAINTLTLEVTKLLNAIKELKESIDQNGLLTKDQLKGFHKTLSIIWSINTPMLPENLSKEITAANNTGVDILAEQLDKNTTRLLSEYKEVDELTPDQIHELEGYINAIDSILQIEELSPTRVEQLTDIGDSAINFLEKDKINKLAGEINENITRSLSEYNEVNELTPDQINKLGNNINQIDFILDDKRLSPTRKKQLTKSKKLAIRTLTLEVIKLSSAIKNLKRSINENRSLTEDQLKELLKILPIIVNINTHVLPKNLSKEITEVNKIGTAIFNKVAAASKKKTQEKMQKERQGRRRGF